MVAFGFGEVIGGFLIGIIIDKIGSKKTSIVNVIIILVLINVTAFSVNSNKYDWITFLMCFLWGFQDSSLNIHIFQILGFEFISQSEPFGVLNIMQGIAAFLF
jgi:predicted MFS family arabinose efflux permease